MTLPLLRPGGLDAPGVRSACSTRDGGVSAGPFASLNLGAHVGDDPVAVQENRRRLAAALGVRPVFLRQVHGVGVEDLREDTPDATEADACVATAPGVACTIMVADCLPVLLASRQAGIVGAAHAGWRGLAGGVIEAVVQRMLRDGEAQDLMAWLGPCIGPEAFEVGPEVREAFVAPDPGCTVHFKAHAAGKWLADLPGLARRRLASLGVAAIHGNDGSTQWCTVADRSRFFSHRRDRVSGRLAAAIWLG